MPSSPYPIPELAIGFIKIQEGLRLRAYTDPGGVWTIGWGHTGKDVLPGMSITAADAERLLAADLQRIAKGVAEAIRVPLLEVQLAALLSFTFNVGVAAFTTSTLARRLNAGEQDVEEEFGRWIFGRRPNGTKVIRRVLVRRRAQEAALFAGRYHAPGPSAA